MADLGRIRKICELRGISIAQLAREIEKSQQQLHFIMAKGKTTIETLEDIAKILMVSPMVFWSSDSINKFFVDDKGNIIGEKTDAQYLDLVRENNELKNKLLECKTDLIRHLEEKHKIKK